MLQLAVIVTITSVSALACELASHFIADGRADYWLSWAEIIAGFIGLAAFAYGAPLAIREMGSRRLLAADALRSSRQVEQLFEMTDMLQSALDHEDANAVLRATASDLLRGFGGALYVFNNSRDRLDLSTSWDWPDDAPLPDSIPPAHCWALRLRTH